MSNPAFFSDHQWAALHPFSNFHTLGNLRVGALKLSEWWSRETSRFLLKTEQETKAKVLSLLKNGKLNDRWIPSRYAISVLAELRPGQSLYADNTLLFQASADGEGGPVHIPIDGIELVAHATDLFSRLNNWLKEQAELLPDAWDLAAPNVPQHVTLLGPTNQIWIHPPRNLPRVP